MIHLLQTGGLSAAIFSTLQGLGLDVRQFAANLCGEPGDWVLVAIDHPRLDQLQRWERLAHRQGMHMFPVHVQNAEVVIGPLTKQSSTGCLTCWERRFYRGRQNARTYAKLQIENDQTEQDALLTAGAKAVVAQMATRQFLRATHAGGSALSVYYFDLKTFTGREWSFIPDSTCTNCAALPDDSCERAHLVVETRPKLEPSSDRIRPLREMSFVEDAFVGHFSNVVSNRKYRWPDHREAVSTVAVPLTETRAIEPCHGFCTRYSDADKVAVLEAVERYCGSQPRAFKPAVFASYSQLRDVAVDPRTFGLHSEREYKANPGVTPYHDDLKFPHVWAYSFRQRHPALVPLDLAFYSSAKQAVSHRFIAIEGSSGCSIGNSKEEAILHGIFEVAERDAYMLLWYARATVPAIDPMTSQDPECRHWCRRLHADGFEILVADGTTDLQIPAVLVFAIRRARWPHLVCASAAHLYPEIALKKALRELYATIGMHEAVGDSRQQEAIELAKDFSSVRELIHHSLAHSTPKSIPHLEFVAASRDSVSLGEMRSRVETLISSDLSRELNGVVARILSIGCDVLVVDQTSPEQREYGLHTVKVLIPGAIPPCWGDHRRRFEYLPRLDAAVIKNWRGSGAEKPQPNPIPHPFI